ncbi:MAG: RNA-binding domain-containing protein [Patescibacteria group bacterium]
MNLNIPESETVEYKETLGDIEDIAKTIVAFANTKGGCICIGVGDDGSLRKIDIADSSFRKISDLNQAFDPRLHDCFSVQKEDVGGFSIIKIVVRKSSYHCHTYKGVCYVRQGSSNQKLSSKEIAERYNYSARYDWSAQVPEDSSLDWIDKKALGFLKEKYFDLKGNAHKTLDDIRFLNSLSLLGDDSVPNHTCLLFIGKEDVRRRVFGGRDKITWMYKDDLNGIEQRLPIEDENLPLIFGIQNILNKINIFNTTLQDVDLFRNDVSQYDPKVIEEIVVNAVAHRDWGIGLWVEVLQTPVSLEVRNPGKFRADLNKVLSENRRPEYLNPALADFLKKMHLMEKEGGGLRKAFGIQIKKGLSIKLRSDNASANPRVDFLLSGKVSDAAFARFMFTAKDLTQEQVVILDKINSGKNILLRDVSNEEYFLVQNLITKTGRGGIFLKIKEHLLRKSNKYISNFSSTHASVDTSKDIILDYAKKNLEFTTQEIYGILSGKSKVWVRVALMEMITAGFLRRVKRGVYTVA